MESVASFENSASEAAGILKFKSGFKNFSLNLLQHLVPAKTLSYSHCNFSH